MNQKANVSKELNARHRKILEGLLKLPENRACADCKAKSLGVHISKVRSATLDTWLPEQVAFIQSMGNDKSNRYWEAELPPNYNRSAIENFIRAKYEEKRWVAKDGRPISPSSVQKELPSVQTQRPTERTGLASYSENPSNQKKSFQTHSTKTGIHATGISLPTPPKAPEPVLQKAEPAVPSAESKREVAEDVSSSKFSFSTDLFDMISMDDGPTENGSEAASTDDNLWAGFQSTGEASSTGKTSPSKPVKSETKPTSGIEDLFKDSSPISQLDASEKPQKDIKNAEVSTTLTTDSSKPVENETKPTSGIDDLLKESSPISQPSASEKPQKDVKNDIMSLFEKGDTTHQQQNAMLAQQQNAMLAQQQYLLMDAAAKTGGLPNLAGNMQQPTSGGANPLFQNWPNVAGMTMPALGKNEAEKYQQQQLAMLAQQRALLMAAAAKSGGVNPPNQNWSNVGNQMPGMMMPVLGNDELEKYLQQMGNMGAANPAGNSGQVPTSSIYAMTKGMTPSSTPFPGLMGPNASLNRTGSSGSSKSQSTSPGSSASRSQSAKEDDFASLMQGMFAKR